MNVSHRRFRHSPIATTLAGLLLLPSGSLLAASQPAPPVPMNDQQRLASDAEIVLAIERHLTNDSATPAHLIDVQAQGGIVTLSGSVDNLLVRDRAGELAETVRGVRSVVNQLMVNPVKRPGEAIEKDAKIAIARDPATDLYQTDVQVMNGTAILTGRVESHAERELAARVIKGVNGVKAVKNDVVVQPKLKRKDAELAADIKRMLQRDPWVDHGSVNVTVLDGVVTLAGTVGSSIERTRAIHEAWVNGVARVEAGGLKVEPGSTSRRTNLPASDQEIEQLIATAWKQHPRLSGFQGNAASKEHVVTLTGKVDHLAAKKIAEEIARNTTGVTGVANHIRVRPSKLPEDAALVQEVKNALLRDPYVSRFDMNVSASNARVYLKGRVDSTFEKNHSEFVVSRVPGVVEVTNSLEVVDLEIPRKTDWAVRRDIEDGLRWSPYVQGREIKVAVENGIAVLSGTATSWEEKIAAGRIAERAGAESVLNQLQVNQRSSS